MGSFHFGTLKHQNRDSESPSQSGKCSFLHQQEQRDKRVTSFLSSSHDKTTKNKYIQILLKSNL